MFFLPIDWEHFYVNIVEPIIPFVEFIALILATCNLTESGKTREGGWNSESYN